MIHMQREGSRCFEFKMDFDIGPVRHCCTQATARARHSESGRAERTPATSRVRPAVSVDGRLVKQAQHFQKRTCQVKPKGDRMQKMVSNTAHVKACPLDIGECARCKFLLYQSGWQKRRGFSWLSERFASGQHVLARAYQE